MFEYSFRELVALSTKAKLRNLLEFCFANAPVLWSMANVRFFFWIAIVTRARDSEKEQNNLLFKWCAPCTLTAHFQQQLFDCCWFVFAIWNERQHATVVLVFFYIFVRWVLFALVILKIIFHKRPKAAATIFICILHYPSSAPLPVPACTAASRIYVCMYF